MICNIMKAIYYENKYLYILSQWNGKRNLLFLIVPLQVIVCQVNYMWLVYISRISNSVSLSVTVFKNIFYKTVLPREGWFPFS